MGSAEGSIKDPSVWTLKPQTGVMELLQVTTLSFTRTPAWPYNLHSLQLGLNAAFSPSFLLPARGAAATPRRLSRGAVHVPLSQDSQHDYPDVTSHF